MKRRIDRPRELEGPPKGPFDPEEVPEEDLWFLPAPPDEDLLPPVPRAPRAPVQDLAAWAEAERRCLAGLIEAAEALARLDEAQAHAPEGVLEHLVLREVADLMRRDAGWMGRERLALYRALRAATGEDARALMRADWAVRRLLAPPAPITDLGGFLGLNRDEITPHPGWLLAPLEAPLHPITRAAAIFAGGRGGWDEALLEPVVLAVRAAAPARFAPVGLGQVGAGGAPDRQLDLWCRAIVRSATAALLQVRQIIAWQARATEATADLSGRTPAALIPALIAAPALSVPMAARATGASRAACLRNLTRMQARGLVRETTGQGRYRFWTLAGVSGASWDKQGQGRKNGLESR